MPSLSRFQPRPHLYSEPWWQRVILAHDLGSFYARATAADMPDADNLTGSIIRAHFFAKRLRKRGLKCWADWLMPGKFRFHNHKKSVMKLPVRHTNSPMRYPGSKAVIAEYIGEILVRNHKHGATYVEPFCGGASVALDLLYNERVSQITLNDLDYRLYSFWDSILNKAEEFCEQLARTPVTMEERENQMEIYRNPDKYSAFYVGFACFFLNKVNRSGILTGGPIGGVEQAGPWKITTKFGKDYFYRVIRKFARYGNRIQLHNMDAVDFLGKVVRPLGNNTFVYLDPPYHGVGKELYKDHFFEREDHCRLSEAVKELEHPWLMSYDDVPDIRALFPTNTIENLNMYYHTYAKKHKDEILIYGNCQPVRRMAGVQ